ncbi:hypothetical protein Bbelb_334900 [Branchiostoma belcheri]|nr:hypothetical protein Bbelb_334900 [Branchiostoma belcheri]
MLMVLHTGEKPYSPAQTTFTSFTFSGPLSRHVGSRGQRNDTPAGTAAILDIQHALLSTCRTPSNDHRCSTFTAGEVMTGELTGVLADRLDYINPQLNLTQERPPTSTLETNPDGS